jgi:hypothetical protein
MKKLIFIVSALVVLGSVDAFAQCYKAQEAEAEQGIRIHSELMVIGLNCQHMASANGKNLYAVYREFTADYANLFGTYEEILLKHFKANGDPNPEASINLLRTDFANKISNDAATMRPDIFCKRYSPRIQQAVAMNYEGLRKWAATIYDTHPVSKPLCNKSALKQAQR